MWDSLLAKLNRVAPERGREAFSEFVKPEAIVEVGVLLGARLVWVRAKVLRAAESDREFVVLAAPEREGEAEIARPGDQVLLFRHRDRQGIAFLHRVVDRRLERMAGGNMAPIVTLSLFTAVYEFERRRFPRVSPSQPVEASLQWRDAEGDASQVVCTLRRISMCGAATVVPHISVEAGMGLRTGVPITLFLRLEQGAARAIPLPSRIARADRDPHTPGKLTLGLEFDNPSPQSLKVLASYIRAETKATLRSGLATLKSLDPQTKRRLAQKGADDGKDKLV